MRIVQKLQEWLIKPIFGSHPHARELGVISELIDNNPKIAQLAHNDITSGKRADTGRKGMSGDQVVRVLLLKQIHNISYRELEFHLQDSIAFRSFARAPRTKPWTWTTLQSNIKRLRPQTLEQINRVLLQVANTAGIEKGRKVRTDCTAIESNIHKPSDSSLLWDGIRVLTRLLREVKEKVPSANIHFTDHTKRARRRQFAIDFPASGNKRKNHLLNNYKELLKVAGKTCGYVRTACEQLKADKLTPRSVGEVIASESLRLELSAKLDTMLRVIDQTTRRVLNDEKVPAAEKVLSFFETHTDVIVKGERDVVFGHKMCLTSGASSLILDCFIEPGNPADATLVQPVLKRQIEIYAQPPRQASFDGGFASAENLRVAKEELGAQDVAFHKKCGLKVEDMTRSKSIYRRLRNFRAGIEGIISALKGRGMNRCTWRSQDSLESFRSYVWGCVLAFNLLTFARIVLSSVT